MEKYTTNHPVFDFFKQINTIPRSSGNEQAISQFMVDFAKKRNLYVRQDDKYNIVIKKDGTTGYEQSPSLLLQGHLDMVCEKNASKVHDFNSDPIAFIEDGDFIKADDTTLGADNGIALAYCLALLDSQTIAHPPLEIIMTTDEEVGLKGATSLSADDLTAKRMINLDSEEEGEILVSCAGGVRAYLFLDLIKETPDGSNNIQLEIAIKGLKGGHSGVDIDKYRGNANKLVGRLLNTLNAQGIPFQLVSINGGTKDNAIPREAFVRILISEAHNEQTIQAIRLFTTCIQKELETSDPLFQVDLHTFEFSSEIKVLSEDQSKLIQNILMIAPNGILRNSLEIENLVESSINLGVLVQTDSELKLAFAIRSSLKSMKHYQMDQISAIGSAFGLRVQFDGDYPEWAFMKDSQLRTTAVAVHESMVGHPPLIKALHAGLECGVFAEKIEGLDMISIGPNMYDVHTPEERLSISSTMRTWDFLLGILAALK